MTTTAGYRARVEKANGCGGESNTMTLTAGQSHSHLEATTSV